MFSIDWDMTLYSIQQPIFEDAVPDSEPFMIVYPEWIGVEIVAISFSLSKNLHTKSTAEAVLKSVSI